MAVKDFLFTSNRSQGYVARRHRSASDRYAASDARLAAGHNKHRHHNYKHPRRMTGDDKNSVGVNKSRRTEEDFVDMEQHKNAVVDYLSDGSETSLSITSTQSEHPRTRTAQ
uniref:Uncharacterized protein n=1 Tax=Romanomermis culicivorax TaxID=13658 RepID=A0A915K7L5_ROMCU